MLEKKGGQSHETQTPNSQRDTSQPKDTMVKLQSKVEMFVSKGLVKWRNNKKELWFNLPKNKTKILTVPFGEDPTFIGASYFQSDDGIESLKLLEKLLDD